MSIHSRTLERLDEKGRRQTVYDVHLRDQNDRPYQRTFASKAVARAFEAAQVPAKSKENMADPRGSRRTVAHPAAAWLPSEPGGRRRRPAAGLSASLRPALPERGQAGPEDHRRRRILSIPVWLVDMIAAVMAYQGRTAADAGELIFTSGEATPLHYSNWRHRIWLPALPAGRAGRVAIP